MSEIKNWKDLWNKNYKGEGDTAGLEKRVNTLNYGNRQGVSYLAWAIVDRIFKLQDGAYEFELSGDGSLVHVDRVFIKKDDEGYDLYMNSYFVVIKTFWQGREHVEIYPLQSSTGAPLVAWSQNDINKALQRGKVKAIAMVSGIGYKLFEDGDLQFEKDEKDTKGKGKTVATPVKTKNTKDKAETKTENDTADKTVEENENEEAEVVEIPEEISRETMIDEIKTQFLSGGAPKVSLVRNYLRQLNLKQVSELDDTQLWELYNFVTK